jgi:hypothetical protein
MFTRVCPQVEAFSEAPFMDVQWTGFASQPVLATKHLSVTACTSDSGFLGRIAQP